MAQSVIWGQHGAGQGGAPMTREEQLAALNLRRKNKGLRPLTEAEVAENERRFKEALKRSPKNGRVP